MPRPATRSRCLASALTVPLDGARSVRYAYMQTASIRPHSKALGIAMDRRRRAPESYLPLRPVEFHVLLSLAMGDRHGYGISQDMESREEASVPDVGTLYRALRRMREQGLIEETEAPRSEATDERRNYYRITAFGREVGGAEARRLERLTRAARQGGLLEAVA